MFRQLKKSLAGSVYAFLDPAEGSLDCKHNKQACPRCALPDCHGQVCSPCILTPADYDRICAPFVFEGEIREAILAFKFHQKLYQGRLLSQLFLAHAEILALPERLIPVPLHKSRLMERGFNQSLEFCQHFRSRLGVPISLDGVTRIKPTEQQYQLNQSQRLSNIQGAFSVKESEFKGVRSVAIVDDVVTSGATVQAIAKLLRQQTQIERIEVWAIARASL